MGFFECPICMEEIAQGVFTQCGHLTHHKCLKDWLAANPLARSCPICREEVDIEKVIRTNLSENPTSSWLSRLSNPRNSTRANNNNPGTTKANHCYNTNSSAISTGIETLGNLFGNNYGNWQYQRGNQCFNPNHTISLQESYKQLQEAVEEQRFQAEMNKATLESIKEQKHEANKKRNELAKLIREKLSPTAAAVVTPSPSAPSDLEVMSSSPLPSAPPPDSQVTSSSSTTNAPSTSADSSVGLVPSAPTLSFGITPSPHASGSFSFGVTPSPSRNYSSATPQPSFFFGPAPSSSQVFPNPTLFNLGFGSSTQTTPPASGDCSAPQAAFGFGLSNPAATAPPASGDCYAPSAPQAAIGFGLSNPTATAPPASGDCYAPSAPQATFTFGPQSYPP